MAGRQRKVKSAVPAGEGAAARPVSGRRLGRPPGSRSRRCPAATHDAPANPTDLSEAQIVAWAAAHRRRVGRWPSRRSGPVAEAPGETWSEVARALRFGLRGLTGFSSLAGLLARGVVRPPTGTLPDLTIDEILRWADAHHAVHGAWPSVQSGPIPEAPEDTWQQVDRALQRGSRGLPGGLTLRWLLARNRRVRNRRPRSPLTEEQVLSWADAHHARTGGWPNARSGPIPEAPRDTWSAVNAALVSGARGFLGGSSLRRLLIERRGFTPRQLTILQVVSWADAHYARTGRWPHRMAGPIPEAPGESWTGVDLALRRGARGLPGGLSLARLLARERGVPLGNGLRYLTIPEVLRWADAHHALHGTWPKMKSGIITEAPGLTWKDVSHALRRGEDSLPGGTTLRALMAEHHRARFGPPRTPMTEERILAWADAHRDRTGGWPKARSGPIPEAPRDTWAAIHKALKQGRRGLPGGSSLARLLHERRGSRYCNPRTRSPLTIPRILAWADAHRARTGRWPTIQSGPIPEAPDENWCAINGSISIGGRGLPGGTSLSKLLARERGAVRGVSPPSDRPIGG